MIRRHLSSLLIALNLALVGGLAYLWLDTQGQPRNIHWRAPSAQKPMLTAPVLPSPAWNEADVSHFIAILDRPLFSPSRRQPPPPPPPAQPVVDPFGSVQLFGLFTNENGGGIVARIDGKIRRMQVKENLGEWTLKSVKDRDATFEHGSETRVLNLAHVRAPTPPPKAPVPGQPAPTAAAPAGVSTQAQRMQAEERERVRMLNEFRAKVGAPLIPMP